MNCGASAATGQPWQFAQDAVEHAFTVDLLWKNLPPISRITGANGRGYGPGDVAHRRAGTGTLHPQSEGEPSEGLRGYRELNCQGQSAPGRVISGRQLGQVDNTNSCPHFPEFPEAPLYGVVSNPACSKCSSKASA